MNSGIVVWPLGTHLAALTVAGAGAGGLAYKKFSKQNHGTSALLKAEEQGRKAGEGKIVGGLKYAGRTVAKSVKVICAEGRHW